MVSSISNASLKVTKCLDISPREAGAGPNRPGRHPGSAGSLAPCPLVLCVLHAAPPPFHVISHATKGRIVFKPRASWRVVFLAPSCQLYELLYD